MRSGWYKESYRHTLAAKGIKTRMYNANKGLLSGYLTDRGNKVDAFVRSDIKTREKYDEERRAGLLSPAIAKEEQLRASATHLASVQGLTPEEKARASELAGRVATNKLTKSNVWTQWEPEDSLRELQRLKSLKEQKVLPAYIKATQKGYLNTPQGAKLQAAKDTIDAEILIQQDILKQSHGEASRIPVKYHQFAAKAVLDNPEKSRGLRNELRANAKEDKL